MKRLALSTFTMALIAAAGSASADYRDARYDDRYDDRYYQVQDDRYDERYGYGYDDRNGSPRFDTAQVIDVDPIIAQSRDRGRRECWWEPASHRYYDRRYGNDYGAYGNYGRYDSRHYTRNGRDSGREGALVGAIVGGAIGNQAGKGDGKKAATIAGALIGSAIGRDIDRNDAHDGRYQTYNDYNRYYDGYRYDDRYGFGYYGHSTRNGMVQRCGWVGDDRYDRYDNRYDDRYGRNDRYDDRVVGYRVTYRYGGQTYRTTTPFHPGSTIRVRVDVDAIEGQRYSYNR